VGGTYNENKTEQKKKKYRKKTKRYTPGPGDPPFLLKKSFSLIGAKLRV
jgi:hypothetical protein